MTELNIGDRPYIIRKCKSCWRFHVIKVTWINDEMLETKIVYTTHDWQDILVLLNVPKKTFKLTLNSLYGKYAQQSIFEQLIKRLTSGE